MSKNMLNYIIYGIIALIVIIGIVLLTSGGETKKEDPPVEPRTLRLEETKIHQQNDQEKPAEPCRRMKCSSRSDARKPDQESGQQRQHGITWNGRGVHHGDEHDDQAQDLAQRVKPVQQGIARLIQSGGKSVHRLSLPASASRSCS